MIPTDHPDSASPLLFFAARAFVAMGARVEIAIGGENLVRRLSSASERRVGSTPDLGPVAARDRAHGRRFVPAAPIAVVQAEGLPNLLHELVHAVQVGRLDDDHGVDYSAIPFDLGTPAGRAVLWDELACCVMSCAYLRAHGRAARAGAPDREVMAEVEAWFREQVEIQPVFYGMEDDPPAFFARVGTLLHTHAAEAQAVLDRAQAATERALLAAGAEPAVAVAAWRPDPAAWWRASFGTLSPRPQQRHSAAELA